MTDTTPVSYTTYRYKGWRKYWRIVTLRKWEGPTFEFEAQLPGTYEQEDYVETGFTMRPVGPVRKVSEGKGLGR